MYFLFFFSSSLNV